MFATCPAKKGAVSEAQREDPSALRESVQAHPGSGQSKSVASEPLTDPVERFRDRVVATWLPKCHDDGFNAADWFKHAESLGAVRCKMYTPEQLRALDEMDALLWKEAYHFTDVLRAIKLPMDPSRTFSGRGEGPVIFVREPDRNNAVIVVNGNHRAGAVMREEYNPDGHPLYVLEFASPECYEKFAGVPLSAKLYIGIDVCEGRRRS
jgi:hypothetical protein